MDRIRVVGAAVVLALAGAMVVAAVDARDRPAPEPLDDPIDSLVDAYARSRRATYKATGTFTRSAEADPTRAVAAEVELVQRPPDRLVRHIGEVSGRRDDRPLGCALGRGDDRPNCALSPPDKPFTAVVDDEVAAFRALVEGERPLYEVRRRAADCWKMTRTRFDPRSGFGVEADLCVDDTTGAVRSLRVDHGDIIEETVYETITTDVTDGDLEP